MSATIPGRSWRAPSRSSPTSSRCCGTQKEKDDARLSGNRPAGLLFSAGLLGAATASAQTLKVAMGSDVKIVDPIWSSAYIQRDFGYMVWDVLFALDDKFDVRPQMVETWDISPDQLTWTFTLRDNKWSNGQPVTAEDCIASLKRWGARDSMGQRMLALVDGFEAVDARTFRMKLREPYGLVLESLAKVSSNAPFMMPKKTAETPPTVQIKVEDVIGSGPFVFKADEWKPGEKVVFTKNTASKPRAEPPSGHGRRQGRQARSRRMDLDPRRPDPGECADGGRDRPRAGAAARPAARPRARQEHKTVRRQSRRQPVPVPLQHA